MSTEAFREFVRNNISDNAQFESGERFSLRQSYDDHLASCRSILQILNREFPGGYLTNYDFNLRKTLFYPHLVS